MLVLSRKAGQEIVIGMDVSVRVLEIRGNRVRVGITAPENVTVHRQEIHQRINGDDQELRLRRPK
jgi:carbon storage regulator